MNGFGALPLPAAIAAMVRPDATERSSSSIASPSPSRGELVAVLDQQPVGALAAVAIVLHPHQHPAAMQPLALEDEFEVALGERFLGRAPPFGLPVAAVPELDRAAAILALGDGAFEIAIVERMVFDLDRQALVVGIERGPRVTAQDLKTPSSSSRKS